MKRELSRCLLFGKTVWLIKQFSEKDTNLANFGFCFIELMADTVADSGLENFLSKNLNF